jgi:RNA polymerase sigma-70 factor (ECF subfamily)
MSNPLRERFWLYRIRTKRDADAFAKVYDLYVSRIYRFVLFKVANEEDAKEIASDVFMKAWEYLAAGKPVRHLSGLLYTIARSATIDHYRKRKLDTVSLDAIAEIADQKLTTTSADAREDLSAVLGAVAHLKEEYRDVLLMRHVDGLSADEIGSALGKTSGNVRVLLHRATNALREILK